jgi:RNA polymerase sigma-70 factor (ECF subfamily)
MNRAMDVEEAFTRHGAAVARYCRRRCATVHDAEDATIEVFAVVCRRAPEIPPDPEALLWLYGIARRVVANQARGARRRERLWARLAAQPEPAPAPAASDAAAPLPRDVAAALAALAPADRELLLLAAWEGLKPAEIARVTGRPAPWVSSRLHRARRRFAAALDDDRAAARLTGGPSHAC